jgi:2-keto-4-pentenoate hydratase/2-oxohepta-3-ene-1,7-dioic acid hydratase in catechol pathway
MRFVTFSYAGHARAGALDERNEIADLGVPMLDLLAEGTLVERGNVALARRGRVVASQVAIEAPVPRPPKVLAIGLNYRDHAAESGQPIPERPIVFAKMATCITGPGQPIYIPRVSRAVDWEGELCIVMGRTARYVTAADAEYYIAGYCIGNDVSVRDWQFHSPTWMMGKSFDTHGPLGPWLVTSDEVDADNLALRTLVNGTVKQESSTGQLIFGPGEIIEYVSAGLTLEPGDVIFTGTPAGVGSTRKPPEFLQRGDTVRIEIEGLGALENPVLEEPTG